MEQNKALKAKICHLEGTYNKLDVDFDTIQNKLQVQTQDNVILTKEKNTLLTESRSLSSQNETLKLEIQKLKSINESRSHVKVDSKATEENKELKTELQQTKQQYRLLKLQVDAEELPLTNAVKQLQGENTALKDKVSPPLPIIAQESSKHF